MNFDKSIIVDGENDRYVDRNKSIGENIRFIRDMLEINQIEFAKQLHISPTKLSNYENGKTSSIMFEDMVALCENLNVSVLGLFFNASIKEVYCDEKTGLNGNTIHWLRKLKRENSGFIEYINELSENPEWFEFIMAVARLSKNKFKRNRQEEMTH